MAARFKSMYKNGPVLPAMSLARAKARANYVLLTFGWSSLELTKSVFLAGKTLFLGNGARCDFGLGIRRSHTVQRPTDRQSRCDLLKNALA